MAPPPGGRGRTLTLLAFAGVVLLCVCLLARQPAQQVYWAVAGRDRGHRRRTRATFGTLLESLEELAEVGTPAPSDADANLTASELAFLELDQKEFELVGQPPKQRQQQEGDAVLLPPDGSQAAQGAQPQQEPLVLHLPPSREQQQQEPQQGQPWQEKVKGWFLPSSRAAGASAAGRGAGASSAGEGGKEIEDALADAAEGRGSREGWRGQAEQRQAAERGGVQAEVAGVYEGEAMPLGARQGDLGDDAGPGRGRGGNASRALKDKGPAAAAALAQAGPGEDPEVLLDQVDAVLASQRAQQGHHTHHHARPHGGDGSPAGPHERHQAPRARHGLAADHKLTREMVAAVSQGQPVLVTWANLHYLDFVRNWVAQVRALGIGSYLVGAMDDAILQELAREGVNVFAMSSGLSLEDFGWGSKTFHKMGREKISLIQTFTKMGFDILVSDVDTVWLQDPLPYVARYPEADILTSSDHLANTTADDGLELFPEAGSAANIGIMLFRTRALSLAMEWNRVLAEDADVWDQNAFNDIFRAGLVLDLEHRRPDRLFGAFRGQLLVGVLPVALFASGHTFFVQRLHERLGLKPYVVHATYQFSGTPGKRHRMRERMLWAVDPPEYYDPPGGLLTFSPRLSEPLLAASVPQGEDMGPERMVGHFALVNAQISQVRAAVALAGALGRTLVFPQLWCGADRWWAPHEGVIPGAHFDLPFRCPLDHVFDLEQWAKKLPEEEFGPDVAYREYSLLDNPRSALGPNDTLTVAPCKAGAPGCEAAEALAGSSTADPVERRLLLREGAGSAALAAALQPHAGYRILHFEDVQGTFGGLSDPADETRFVRRMHLYTSLWCCVNGHPGHIWYDAQWDKGPHVDRHNRHMPAVWRPILGP